MVCLEIIKSGYKQAAAYYKMNHHNNALLTNIQIYFFSDDTD